MILSVDSSAVTASVALTDGDKIIKSEFINAGLTHRNAFADDKASYEWL